MSEFGPQGQLLTPEAELSAELLARKSAQDVVVDMPGCNVEYLGGKSGKLHLATQREIAGAHYEQEGVDQSLVGILAVDSEHALGMVYANIRGEQILCISKLVKDATQKGERATLIGVLRQGEELDIGRDDLDASNNYISRKHAKISFGADSSVTMTDTSKNHDLDLITAKEQYDLHEGVSTGGLKRLLRKRTQPNLEKRTVEISDYISDLEGWAVKSRDLVNAVKSPQIMSHEEESARAIDTSLVVDSGRFEMRDWSKEQLVNKARELLSSGAPQEVVEVLMKGSYKGKQVDISEGIARNEGIIAHIRMTLAEMMTKNPDTAKEVMDKEIVGVHGTRSAALVDIIREGKLFSARKAQEKGLKIITGEHIFQKPEGQASISFTNMADTSHAFSYSGSLEPKEQSVEEVISEMEADIAHTERAIQEEQFGERVKQIYQKRISDRREVIEEIKSEPNGLRAQLLTDSFPVLLGISNESVYKGEDEKLKEDKFWDPIRGTSGDYNEFRAAREEIELDELMIAVPESRISKLKVLLEQYGHDTVSVVPIEHFVNSRYNEIYGTNY